MQFLLYGANGYTGQLIAEEAANFNLKPILAGRNADKIRALAKRLGYDYRIFDLQDTAALEAALREVPVVLHAAGPFIHTARPMLEACLRTGVHYLDITGEIAVFEMAARLNDAARSAGIMLLPGAGFDVVPTDCLALFLKQQLPDATHLKLAFSGLGGGVSHGTAITMAENLGKGGAMRQHGKIINVPMGHHAMYVDFPGGARRFVMSIPWGDVSTAYYTTGIPNIETYTSIKPATYKWIQRQRYFNWLLRTSFVRNIVKKQIQKRPAGPTAEQRAQAKTLVWGEVHNAQGDLHQAGLITPEGYTTTALTSLIITKRVLHHDTPTGFQTPASAYGADLILEIPGTERMIL